MDQGNFPLTSADKLPNVTVAFPGEHWSNAKAATDIVPGMAVVPVNSGGKLYCRKAVAADPATQLAIALRTVQIPDVNTGPSALGPNEIMNQTIEQGEYVHRYHSGAFWLTLIVADTYAPGDLIGWDENGVPQGGKGGSGAWAKNAAADIDSIYEVTEFRKIPGLNNQGILGVRSLRGQF